MYDAVDVLLERQLSVKGDAGSLIASAGDIGTPLTISWRELTCWCCRGGSCQINCVLSELSFSRLEHIQRLKSSIQRRSCTADVAPSAAEQDVLPESSVFDVRVDTNVVHGSDGCDVSRVQDKQMWAKDWPLTHQRLANVEPRNTMACTSSWQKRHDPL